MRGRWAGGALVVAGVLGSAAPAGASPALTVREDCPSGSDASGIQADVTGLTDGTHVTFTVTGGDRTIGPVTFVAYQGRVGIGVGFGDRVEEARVEAIVRSDGDAVVEPGEQLLTGTVSRPCRSSAK
jgi:hypothetical protein